MYVEVEIHFSCEGNRERPVYVRNCEHLRAFPSARGTKPYARTNYKTRLTGKGFRQGA